MIGVFDSGSGGLTVLRELRAQAPNVDIVYFGDLVNIPYGSKTAAELGALTTVAIEKLLSEGATNIVSACNSVSSSVAQPLIQLLGRKQFGMIEMVSPTVGALQKRGFDGEKIGVVATPATVSSGLYQNAFSGQGIHAEAYGLRGLTPAIEAGASRETLLEIIMPGVDALEMCDVIVLGCTQYPLAKGVFESYAPHIEFFDPARAVAEHALEQFGTEGTGVTRLIISKNSAYFRMVAREFFGDGYTIELLE